MRGAFVSTSLAPGKSKAGFSLVEMLLACGLLVIVCGIVLTMTAQISKIWSTSTSRIQTFQEARAGFEAMTRRLSQATLNTYYDYYQNTAGGYVLRTPANAATFVPTTYNRVSDLHFISGQGPTLLNASPTAITDRTRGTSIWEENPGLSRKSGDIRVSTRKKA